MLHILHTAKIMRSPATFILRFMLLETWQRYNEDFQQSLGGYYKYPYLWVLLAAKNSEPKFEQPSRRFLQFAEIKLSNKKSDPCHNHTMSMKNCMLRIPNSYNTKYGNAEELLRFGHIASAYEKQVLADEKAGKIQRQLPPATVYR